LHQAGARDQIANASKQEKFETRQIGFAPAQSEFAIEHIDFAREQRKFASSQRWNGRAHRIDENSDLEGSGIA
jgi:hypothetical protein